MSVDPVLIVSILFSRPHSKFLVSYQSGAGPSGLALPLTLRKNHIDVCIIDKEPGPRLGERAAGVSVGSFTSFSHYRLACIFLASLDRAAQDLGDVRRCQPRMRANPNQETTIR
jgi:hypothetical protein